MINDQVNVVVILRITVDVSPRLVQWLDSGSSLNQTDVRSEPVIDELIEQFGATPGPSKLSAYSTKM